VTLYRLGSVVSVPDPVGVPMPLPEIERRAMPCFAGNPIRRPSRHGMLLQRSGPSLSGRRTLMPKGHVLTVSDRFLQSSAVSMLSVTVGIIRCDIVISSDSVVDMAGSQVSSMVAAVVIVAAVDIAPDMAEVAVCGSGMPGMKMRRIVSPSVGGMIGMVEKCTAGIPPETVVNRGCHNINGLDDIVGSVHIGIAYNLYNGMVSMVPFDFYRSDVLIGIVADDSLNHDKMDIISFGCLHDTKIVDLSVSVEIEVGYLQPRIVQPPFKIGQIRRFSENGCYRLEVEVAADLFILCIDSSRLLCRKFRRQCRSEQCETETCHKSFWDIHTVSCLEYSS